MTGIYYIRKIDTRNCYIGSSINIKSRLRRHLYDLKNNVHSSRYLQRVFNKYGKEIFKVGVLEICSKEVLIEREQYWMNKLFPVYNMSKIAGSCLGVKHTKESSEKKRKYAIDNNIKPPTSTWENRQKRVIMLDYNTSEELVIFKSLAEACRAIGKDFSFVSTISSVCNGKRNSAYSFKWRWHT